MNPGAHQFGVDPERTVALAKKGAAVRWAKPRPGDPYRGTILDAMDAAGLSGPSWRNWHVLVKAVHGLELDEQERAIFTRYTGRREPPGAPVRQVYAICGRRSGKTRVASVVAFHTAASRDYRPLLAPGEVAIVPLLAADKRQAKQALDYVRGLARMPTFKPCVARELAQSIELTTACTLEVKTASYRLVRGFSVPAIVADELAFWWQGADSANPDTEVIAALLPAMATMPHGQLWGLSTPYAKAGALYEAFQRYYAVEGADVLVWQAPSLDMNITLNRAEVTRALERDPESASAEWLAQFRIDVANFIAAEAYDAAVDRGRPLELPVQVGRSYVGFVDPSGGASDAMTVAIAHLEGERAVLDVVREAPAPFNPESVTRDYAALLKSYGVTQVTGDRYSAEWVAAAFAKHGVTYQVAEQSRSQLYLELLGPLNSGRVVLPPHTKLRAQFLGLERRTARSGQDAVDHRVGGHDDLANSVAGALVLVLGGAAFPGWNLFEFARQQAAAHGVASALALGPAPADQATRTTRHILRRPSDGTGAPVPDRVTRSADERPASLGALLSPPPAPPPNTLFNCSHCGRPRLATESRSACPTCGLQT